ncbi:MAG TPA: hypothetical protein VK846_15610 [Candidatus Limnocylindria bacterium]|nr:hypothetical protein [Candidatus Limnocylindria bacterium]
MKERFLRSGIIFTVLSLVVGGGNFVFQGIIGRFKEAGEFGLTNTTQAFTELLGLSLLAASVAVVHHIAHFRGTGDEARLQGLLVGCRRFLLKFTIAASILGILLIQPLSHYFGFTRASLTTVALLSLLIGLWSTFATALCQGLGWFKRLALFALAGVLVKLIFVWVVTRKYPTAEMGVLAVAVGTLMNFAVFVYWKDLFKKGEGISPWDREFFRYFAVAAAGVLAQYCFTKGDLLVAKKYFTENQLDAYTGAIKIASGLHLAVGPLLVVLFTARSSARSGRSLSTPLGLLALYAGGLVCGATVLFFARDLCVRLLRGENMPDTSAMIGPLAITMIFVGLIQALGMWAMASNWIKTSFFYGILGAAYWVILLRVGKTPSALLQTMPVIAAVGFIAMLVVWLVSLRRDKAAGTAN